MNIRFKRVYFTHEGGIGFAADFFVKKYDNTDYGYDYYMSDCEYVLKFLEDNPNFKYIGSTDNNHSYGWGMSFKDFHKVDKPKLENE